MRPPSSRLARLLLPLGLLALACGEPSRPNVILISIDTLRADRLGCYGHGLPTSPSLDALAAEGVLFEEALSTSSWTLPSHASLLTGAWPSRHGALTNDRAIAASLPTLAQHFEGLGYVTGAFVNNVFLHERFGFARGFQTFRYTKANDSLDGAAPAILDDARAWLDRTDASPFFLFVHLFDVHSPYGARPEIEREFVQRRHAQQGTTKHLLGMEARTGRLAAEELEQLSRFYDAGIRQLDAELGDFFAAVEERGLADTTLLVITSDHGEEFGEHGGVSHGDHLHGELLRVPLLIRGPGVPRGRRVAGPVSIVDVAPTLLDVVGAGTAEVLDGRSLRPLWQAGPSEMGERAILAEGGPTPSRDTLAAIQVGRHKLLVDESRGRRQLYDLVDDPGEQQDVSGSLPELAERLAGLLSRHRGDQGAGIELGPLPPEQIEQLRALGYAVE